MQETKTLPITMGIRLTADQAKRRRALAVADDRRPSALARRMVAEALALYESPTEVPVG